MDELMIVSSSDAPPVSQPASGPSIPNPVPAEGLNEAEQAELAQMQANDALAFAGPKSPTEYQFERPFGQKFDLTTDTGKAAYKESMARETAFREFLHAEGIPVSIAKEVDRQAMLGYRNPPTAEQRAKGKEMAVAQLSRRWGSSYDANLAIARGEIERMTAINPHIAEMIDTTGLNNSVWFAETLVNLARAKGRVK